MPTPRTATRTTSPSSASGLHIPRRFTTKGVDPLASFAFVTRTGRIANADGTAVFEMPDIEVPAHWDQTAVDVLSSKYFRKAGVPQIDQDGTPRVNPDGSPVLGPETSARQWAYRLANAWMIWGMRGGYFASPDDAEAYRDEIVYMLIAQMASPNSPQHFNTGLFDAYGIAGEPDGNWYVDPATGELVETPDLYSRSNASACYIQATKDQLVGEGSIMDLWEREARLFKGGSGSGTNFSAIRGAGEPLSHGGFSSGLMSFLKVGDRSAGAIQSGGTTRRAAKMVILDADHPDIEEFIWWKVKEEDKVAALVAAGYSSDWQGEAYATVSGQNSNNSVRLSRGFMQAVREDHDWNLTRRTDGAVSKTLKAADLWRQITEAAWRCADPGVQFDDIINEWATATNDGPIRGSNPCFPASARVHTDQGLIPFGELVLRVLSGESFQVWTFDETNPDAPRRSATLTTPETFMVNGVREIVRLRFSNGAELRCTPDHRIFTLNRGYVCANELTEDDEVKIADLPTPAAQAGYDLRLAEGCGVRPGEVVHSRYRNKAVRTSLPAKWTEDLAHLLGWLTGDGSIRLANPTWRTWSYEPEVRESILPYHLRLIEEIAGTGAVSTSDDSEGTQVSVKRTPWRSFLAGLGLDNHGPNKRVPASLFQAPADIVAGYLRGLFDADSTVVDEEYGASYVGLDSSSNGLLRDVQLLLGTFGIASRIHQVDAADDSTLPYASEDDDRRHALTYSLRIGSSDIALYAQHIGFRHPGKAECLGSLLGPNRSFDNVTRSVHLVDVQDEAPEVTFNLSEPSNHSYVVDGIVVRNCSEYMHIDDTACNLASLNLGHFFDSTSQSFDVGAFTHAARLWTLVLEITVSMSHYPSAIIARNSYEHRTLGLGYANVGAMLMRAGLAYDSDEGRAVMAAVTALMHFTAAATSAEMAAAVGPCVAYGRNVEPMRRVIHNHWVAAHGGEGSGRRYEDLTIKPVALDHVSLSRTVFAPLSAAVRGVADSAKTLGKKNGFRNMQFTVLAPTGCLVPDTLVTTDHGLVALGRLGDPNGSTWQDPAIPGVRVLTDEGPREATRFFINGYADVVRVVTQRGHALRGTPEHRIKVVTSQGTWEWCRLAEIRRGDLVPLAKGLVGPIRSVPLAPVAPGDRSSLDRLMWTPREMTPELAEFLGYFAGAGALHTRGLSLHVDLLDGDLAKHMSNLLRDLFGVEPISTPHEDHLELSVHSPRLAAWFASAGLVERTSGATRSGEGYGPVVPAAVLATNNPSIYGAFLRGLFEADGIITSGVSLSTTDDAFVSQVQQMLTALGLLTHRSGSLGVSTNATIHRVAVRGGRYNQRFAERVGFISARKSLALGALANVGEKKDWVPLTSALIDELVPAGHGTRPTPHARLRAAILTSQRRSGDLRVARHLAEELAELTGDIRVTHLLDFFYDVVAEDAAEDGAALTYDLSVPDNVTYVAGGFVSHNTIGLQMSCDTTGIEPDFALVKFKKLAGGGYMKLVNSSVAQALVALGYDDATTARIITYALGTQSLDGPTAVNRQRLLEAGLAESTIDAIVSALPSSMGLEFAANQAAATQRDSDPRLAALDPSAPGFSLLRALGFSAPEVRSSSLVISGHETVEGSPDLRPEHLAVFDCANYCGDGTRTIHWTGHVRALGAIAPFLSGSASKTVNLPNEASVEDVQRAYELSYELGVKACAIYRDGSKLSQVLSSSAEDEAAAPATAESDASTIASHVEAAVQALLEPEAGVSPTQHYAGRPPVRFRLPTMVVGVRWKFNIGGTEVFLRTGQYPDGTCGEIFLDLSKEGSTLKGIMSCFAIAVSAGLQHGVPLSKYVDMFVSHTFEPHGPVQGHPNLKMANSIVDAVFRILGHHYLGREELVQIKSPAPHVISVPAGETVVVAERTPEPSGPAALPGGAGVTRGSGAVPSSGTSVTPTPTAALASPYTGDICPNCSSMRMIKSGTCAVCQECATTTGCS